jgi:hypothetical protein
MFLPLNRNSRTMVQKTLFVFCTFIWKPSFDGFFFYLYDPHEDDGITDENDKIGRQFVTEFINDFISKLIVQ